MGVSKEEVSFKVNAKVLQEVVNYLATKPYAEVFKLIDLLQQATVSNDSVDSGSKKMGKVS